MKVAFVVGGLPFGGIENQLLSMCSYLIKGSDIQPVVVNISGTGMLVDDFIKANIDYVNISNDLKSIKTYNVSTIFKLRKAFKEINPDLIHTMHFSANYFSRLASIGLNKPIITHIRSMTGERKAFRRFADKFLSRYTTMYLSVSEMVKDFVEERHNLAKVPNKVLYNFFDVEKLNFEHIEKTSFFDSDAKVIVFTGRLVKLKNVDKIIKSLPFVQKRFPESRLLIVGDGGLLTELKELAASLNISDSVVFTGYQKDVMSLLNISDVFAMPSEYEGFGNSHLEAMFVGLPAVISQNVPTKEFAQDAVVISDTAPEKLAEAFIEIFSDENLRKKMSFRAKEIAESFTLDNYIKKLTEIYKECLRTYSAEKNNVSTTT